ALYEYRDDFADDEELLFWIDELDHTGRVSGGLFLGFVTELAEPRLCDSCTSPPGARHPERPRCRAVRDLHRAPPPGRHRRPSQRTCCGINLLDRRVERRLSDNPG